MRYRIWCAVVVASFVVAQGGACVNVAEGGLVDWMFNCDWRQQVTACYPTAPVYGDDEFGLLRVDDLLSIARPDGLPADRHYAARAHVPAAARFMLLAVGRVDLLSHDLEDFRSPRIGRSCPPIGYRLPVTVKKPCTTYAWQADRRECGFFDRLFGKCDSIRARRPAVCR